MPGVVVPAARAQSGIGTDLARVRIQQRQRVGEAVLTKDARDAQKRHAAAHLDHLRSDAVEVRVKKRVKRQGRVEEMGELVINFGSLDELNGLIERLRAA